MKVRLGTLRLFIQEVLVEQSWVPGRWSPDLGEPVSDDDLEAMGEVDDRMVGDGIGGSEDDISDHLKADEKGQTLGDPPDETIREHLSLSRELRRYFLQEQEDQDSGTEPADGSSAPPGSEGEDAVGGGTSAAPQGFYTPFDMERDHSATWYRSPGQAAGTGGDPYRSEDPHAQLGFHAPGSDGESKPLAPPIWQLSAGSDTSKVLGANAKADSGGVDSGDGSKESEAPGGDVDAGEEGDEAEGEESGSGRPGDRRN